MIYLLTLLLAPPLAWCVFIWYTMYRVLRNDPVMRAGLHPLQVVWFWFISPLGVLIEIIREKH